MGLLSQTIDYIPSFLKNNVMDELEERLRQLVAETCRHKFNSIERQQGLTQIIRVIVKSGKLWKDNASYYEDALQQTWVYFCSNLCEATTCNNYDPSRGSVIGWVNAYLRWRLQDCCIEKHATLAQTASFQIRSEDELIECIEALEAPPDIPPMLESTRQWAQTDPDDDLRRIHIYGHPEVNCQVLILKRLPPETSWETISAKFDVSVSTLSSFYRRQCIPRLRKFGESQGYL